jgi:hypothetical protein
VAAITSAYVLQHLLQIYAPHLDSVYRLCKDANEIKHKCNNKMDRIPGTDKSYEDFQEWKAKNEDKVGSDTEGEHKPAA